MSGRLGERLIAAGLSSAEAIEQALQQQKVSGRRLGECLVALKLVSETALLRFLAAEYGTRYVTGEKLAQVKITHDVLDRVPVRFAEAQGLLPLAWEPEDRLLSVVAADPQNKEMLSELAQLASAEEVFSFIGLRRSIEAGIRKHYYGDPTAFEEAAREPEPEPAPQKRETTGARRTGTLVAAAAEASPRETSSSDVARPPGHEDGTPRVLSEEDYARTVAVLIAKLEGASGHSQRIARCATLLAHLLGLPPADVTTTKLVAQLHMFGRSRHLTIDQVGESDAARAEARRLAQAPVTLLGAEGLPSAAAAALLALSEPFRPELPIATRIVTAVDAALTMLRERKAERESVLEHLSTRAGSLYDPSVVQVLLSVLRGELLRRRIAHGGRWVLVADHDEARRGRTLQALHSRGLAALPVTTVAGLEEVILRRSFDLLLLSPDLGLMECLSAVQRARSQPECAGLPILVHGALEKGTRDRLLSAGVTQVLSVEGPASLSDAVAEQLRVLAETNGGGRVIEASSEELPLPELLRLLRQHAAWGRLTLRAACGEGMLHFEAGVIVAAVMPAASGAAALQRVEQAQWADYTFDPDALLLDPPRSAA